VANIAFTTIAGNDSVTGLGSNSNGGSGGTILATAIVGPVSGDNCSGTPASLGFNYADGSCSFANQQASDVNNGGPALLGPLADNGGPTRTLLPAEGSPILDRVELGAGACDEAPLDQRDITRPQGDLCDTGAVEREVVDPGPEPPAQEPPAAEPVAATPTFTG
jgi:hypothetical protein